MAFAALSTVTAVFENILSFAVDLWGWSRKKAIIFNIISVSILSMPCVFGFNILSDIQLLGEGSSIMDVEDFLVSNNLLPLGALVYIMFCTINNGWGFDNFIKEADTGKGIKFPAKLKTYMKFILPAIMVVIYLKGYWDTFSSKGMIYMIPWGIIAIAFLLTISWFIFGKVKNKNYR